VTFNNKKEKIPRDKSGNIDVSKLENNSESLSSRIKKFEEDEYVDHIDLKRDLKYMLQDANLRKDIRYITREINFKKDKSFSGIIDILFLCLTLIMILALGAVLPLTIIDVYEGESSNIWALFIITVICLLVALHLRNYMWGQLFIITLSISFGIIITHFYNKHKMLGCVSQTDVIALSLTITALLITMFQPLLNRIYKK